ncbi:MAG: 2-phospho-L-lactate transferase [Hyphomonadaceae bacterium]
MKVVVLTGGVGGAKLVLGLQHVLAPENITAIVNTGDDFRHFGLYVSPDIDTLVYTLSGKANAAQGWGREGETWNFMAAVRSLGGADWFSLGDGDLALHVLRSARLAQAEPLSAITADIAKAWNIGARILPMSDDSVATWLETDEGELEFQRYFVQRRCEAKVRAIGFRGAEKAAAAPGVIAAIEAADAILIAPSNPYLSVDPILAVAPIAAALRAARAPIVAVSPLVGGKAVKGPTAKLMQELKVEVTNRAIARHYHGLIAGLVIDSDDDAPEGLAIERTATLMTTLEDRMRVARAALALAQRLSAS